MNCQVLNVLLPLAVPSVWCVDIDTRSVRELISGDIDDQSIDFKPGMLSTLLHPTNVEEFADFQGV